jgi:hypothetical protein
MMILTKSCYHQVLATINLVNELGVGDGLETPYF